MSWVAVGAAAAAALLGAYNTDRVAKKRDRRAAAGIRAQSEIQREQNAKVMETLAKVQESSPTQARASAADEYLKQVQNAQALARAGLQETGYSDAYDESASKAGDKAQQYANTFGQLLARVDAPVMQRTREGFSFGDLATDIGLTKAKSAGQQWIDALKMKTIQRNPWIDAASAAASAYAGSGGGGSSGGGSSGGGGYGAFAPNNSTSGWSGNPYGP